MAFGAVFVGGLEGDQASPSEFEPSHGQFSTRLALLANRLRTAWFLLTDWNDFQGCNQTGFVWYSCNPGDYQEKS